MKKEKRKRKRRKERMTDNGIRDYVENMVRNAWGRRQGILTL